MDSTLSPDLTIDDTCIKTLKGHTEKVTALVVLPDASGDLARSAGLLSGSADKTIKIWSLDSHTCTATLTGHSRSVYALAALPALGLIASGSSDTTIKLWSIRPQTLSEIIAKDLRAAISKGVPLWNAGDYAGCATLYKRVAQKHAAVEPQLAAAVRCRHIESPPSLHMLRRLSTCIDTDSDLITTAIDKQLRKASGKSTGSARDSQGWYDNVIVATIQLFKTIQVMVSHFRLAADNVGFSVTRWT
jgi:WD40 repeat protein